MNALAISRFAARPDAGRLSQAPRGILTSPRNCLNCYQYLPDLEWEFPGPHRTEGRAPEAPHGCTLDCVAHRLFRTGLDPGQALLRHRDGQVDFLQPAA